MDDAIVDFNFASLRVQSEISTEFWISVTRMHSRGTFIAWLDHHHRGLSINRVCYVQLRINCSVASVTMRSVIQQMLDRSICQGQKWLGDRRTFRLDISMLRGRGRWIVFFFFSYFCNVFDVKLTVRDPRGWRICGWITRFKSQTVYKVALPARVAWIILRFLCSPTDVRVFISTRVARGSQGIGFHKRGSLCGQRVNECAFIIAQRRFLLPSIRASLPGIVRSRIAYRANVVSHAVSSRPGRSSVWMAINLARYLAALNRPALKARRLNSLELIAEMARNWFAICASYRETTKRNARRVISKIFLAPKSLGCVSLRSLDRTFSMGEQLFPMKIFTRIIAPAGKRLKRLAM